MPSDTTQIPYHASEPQTVNTVMHPADSFGYREVPVIRKDVYGRKFRVEMKKLNESEYQDWLKEQNGR